MSATNTETKHDASTGLASDAHEAGCPSEREDQDCAADTSASHKGTSRGHGSGLQFMLATVVGMLVSVPLGWLLSYAAQLPFYLGLFFFPLFGLMIGAAMHRAAHRARPYHTTPLLVGTTMAVMFCWMFSLTVEANDMPVWVATHASRNPRLKLHNQTIEAYRATVADNMTAYLKETYPPGGLIGYARWASTNGEITQQVAPGLLKSIHAPQRGIWWLIRVMLSVGLLAFGIGSQTLILREEEAPSAVAT